MQAGAGDSAGAFATAGKIGGGKQQALRDIAAAQAAAGDAQGALETARLILRAATRLWALTAIAAALAGRR